MNVEVGKAVLFNGLAISMDKDGKFTLRLLDTSSVELANGLICNKTEFKTDLGTDIEPALKDLVIYSYTDGV